MGKKKKQNRYKTCQRNNPMGIVIKQWNPIERKTIPIKTFKKYKPFVFKEKSSLKTIGFYGQKNFIDI